MTKMHSSHIQWAIYTLKQDGHQIQQAIPELILYTPWSEVSRFVTDQGLVYFKKVPPALFLEANIITMLHEQFHAPVPHIIAANPELHCFLMFDAGIPLQDFFKQGFQPEVFIQVVQDYTAMQILTADKIDLFLHMGVPDWRLEQLPKLYQQLIAQEDLLINDGVTKAELKKLRALEPELILLCEQLSHYAIPAALGHCDFHDKNILVNIHTHQTTIIDLGEVAITYPFFSFLNCVHRVKEIFALTDSQYQHLIEACFKHWLTLESRTHLFEILSIIQQCWSIHSVLGEYRLMQSVDRVSFQALKRQGRLAGNLRHWLEQY